MARLIEFQSKDARMFSSARVSVLLVPKILSDPSASDFEPDAYTAPSSALSCELDQATFNYIADQLVSGLQAELLQGACSIRAHCLHAQFQLLGDIFDLLA